MTRNLQTETGPSHKLLLLSDRNPHRAFLSPGYLFPSVLNHWQVSKGAPYPVKAASHSVYARNVAQPSSCSSLMAGAHVLCCWLIPLSGKKSSQDVRGFGFNLVAGRMLAHYSFPVGPEMFGVRREKSGADSFTLKQVILGWKEPQEVTHVHLRQAYVLPTELLHVIWASQGRKSERETWTWGLVPSPRLLYLVIDGKDAFSLLIHIYTGIPGGRSIKHSKRVQMTGFPPFLLEYPSRLAHVSPSSVAKTVFNVYFLLCHCWDTLLKAEISNCFLLRWELILIPLSILGAIHRINTCLTQSHGFYSTGKWQKTQELWDQKFQK